MLQSNQIIRQLRTWIFAACCLGLTPLPSLAHGDLHAQLETFVQRVEQEPRNVQLRLQRADALRRHREFSEALAEVTAAEKIVPGLPAVELQRARIWFDSEHFLQAVRAANVCLAHEVSNPDALALRARSQIRLGQTVEAVKDFSAVLALAARPLPDLYLERAACQASLNRLDDAVRGLDEGMARLGPTPSLALPAIEYERQHGACAAALARLEKARPFFDPESFLALRGEILLQAGRPVEAARDFQTALASVAQFSSGLRESSPLLQLAERLRGDLKNTAPIHESR